MAKFFRAEAFNVFFYLLILFVAAALLRPLLPIDETRYLSVAWEMHLRQSWLDPLTMNFAPYHHKPPMLFWLINLSWSLFGISREAAMVPVFVSAFTVVMLTAVLARRLFPAQARGMSRVHLLMIGSLPFLIYSTLMMFDIMMTVVVLGVLLCLWAYGGSRRPYLVPLAALLLGLGVLVKGPVAYLYVIFPMLLAPLWLPHRERLLSWYLGILFIILLSIIPVLFWLVPMLKNAEPDFVYWLLWEQTAGRVAGKFSAAHVRPFYFYLPLVPLMAVPWLFFPALWRNLKTFKTALSAEPGLRFILCWIVPVFVSFCMISGKQPHYMVPLLPGMIILITYFLRDFDFRVIARTAAAMVVLIVLFQAGASVTFFHAYDLRPLADYISKNAADRDIAFARKYHGQLTFLGRLTRPVESISAKRKAVDAWLEGHPDGIVVLQYRTPEDVARYEELVSMPYRGKHWGAFAAKK